MLYSTVEIRSVAKYSEVYVSVAESSEVYVSVAKYSEILGTVI